MYENVILKGIFMIKKINKIKKYTNNNYFYNIVNCRICNKCMSLY